MISYFLDHAFLYAFIFVTVYLSYYRARGGLDFWTTFWIEPGFLGLILLSGFLNGAFREDVTFVKFLAGWILPMTCACVIAFAIGRFVLWRRGER